MKHNYLLESEDSYLVSLKIAELIDKCYFKDVPIHSYDMEEVSLSNALEDLDTYGLFSEKKVIVISNIEALTTEGNEKDIEHFLKYFKASLDTILVIVTAKKLNNTKKITKELKKNLDYISLTTNAEDFVKKELQGYTLETGVVRALVSYTFEDIGRLHQECEKLKLYRIDTKKISLSDVDELVVKKLGDSRDLTFEFVRTLASKDKKKSLSKYQELLSYAVEPLSLIGLLASQFLIMYQVKILEKRGLSNNEIASMLGEKPYRIQKTRELTNYYSEQELRIILRKLADMDLKIKTSDVDGNFLIELFILECV